MAAAELDGIKAQLSQSIPGIEDRLSQEAVLDVVGELDLFQNLGPPLSASATLGTRLLGRPRSVGVEGLRV